ncbi:MAG: hypothetical protein ABS52_11170 [Gemmatimonadetes bacterium SCN 70-22]|nr:MAG: hypothetical protein ABS52_11170 [Gemmatimonadetes bacterium SCN 70-22]
MSDTAEAGARRAFPHRMTDPYSRLTNDIPSILAEWRQLRLEEPRLALPDAVLLDSLPELLTGLFAAVSPASGDAAAWRELVDRAVQHGASRREQGHSEELLFGEYHLLREAIWRHLRRYADERSRDATAGASPLAHPPPSAEASGLAAIHRVDHGLTIATRASLLGFHRRELVASGRWSERIAELVDSA